MWISILKKIGKKIPLWIWMSIGVVIVYFVVAWAAYTRGQQDTQRKWDASVERGKAAIAQLKKRQVVINTVVETVYKDRIVTIKEKADVIEKQIPIFIPDYRDTLSGGFRLLHDSAATSTFPDSSRIPNSLPVSVGEVASTINRNYTQCNIWREQVIGWQTWYSEQSKPSL